MTNFYDDKPYVGLGPDEYKAIFDMQDIIKKSGIDQTAMDELKAEHDRLSSIELQSNFDQFYNGLTTAWQSMKISDLDAKRADAIQEKQEELIAELDKKIAIEKQKLQEMEQPSKQGFWATTGAVVASAGRNLPEMIGTGIATAGLSVIAPGAGTYAGGSRVVSILAKGVTAANKYKKSMNALANSAIIYNDTVDVARGDLYSRIEQQYPDMPKEEVYKKSLIGGRLVGAAEAATGFLGVAATGSRVIGNIGAKTGTAIGRKIFRKTGETAVNKEIKDAVAGAVSNSVANGVINEKNFMSPAIKKALIESVAFVREGLYEGVTENLQDRIEQSILNAVASDEDANYVDIFSSSVGDLSDLYVSIVSKLASGEELTPEESDVLSTLTNVSLAYMALGGTYRGVGYAVDKIGGGQESKNIVGQIGKAKKTVAQLDEVLQMKQESSLRKQHPDVVDKMVKNLAETGRIPQKLYADADVLHNILNEAKDDMLLQRQAAKAKISQKIEQAKKSDGVVEFSTEEVYDVLLDPNNDKLYQLIKNDVSSDPVDMSVRDVEGMIADIAKNDNAVGEAVKDPNSAYNYIMKTLTDSGQSEEVAKANATLGQFVFNAMARMGKVERSLEEVYNDINLMLKTGQYAEKLPAQPKAKKAKKKKPLSLLSFLKSKGGLKDAGGELKNMDARFSPGLVNNQTGIDLDTARELAQEAGYFGVAAKNELGTTTVSDLMDLIRTELGGQKIYSELDNVVEQQEDMDEAEYRAERVLDENNVDYSGMTLDEKLNLASRIENQESEVNESGDLVDALGRVLFDTVSEYNKETININGVERPVKNSEGKKIANTEGALRAFYNWFGNSKAVNEHGQPLVMKHWTPYKFDKFKLPEIEIGYHVGTEKQAKQIAKQDGRKGKILTTYIRFENALELEDAGHWGANSSFMNQLVEKNIFSKEESDNLLTTKELSMEEKVNIIRQRIKEKGYDSIKYINEYEPDGGYSYLLLDPDQAIILNEKGELRHEDDQYVAGWFQRNPLESIIALTTAAKPETFAHEMFHLFSSELFRQYNSGMLNEVWERNTRTLAKWAGVKAVEGQPIVLDTKAEEKLANVFVRYLATGKAPVGYLKQMFDMFAEMFMHLYRMIRGGLNKRVTQVFDQIFITYERQQAEIAQRRMGFIAKPENMSLEAYERYIAEKRALTVRATTKEVQAATELQKVMTEEVYQAEREQAFNDAYNELMSMPVYQMLNYASVNKININSLPAGKEIADDKLVDKKGHILLSQLWAQYKDIAPTQEDLVDLINNTPRIDDVANYIAEQHMQEWIAENKPELLDVHSEIAQRNERAFRLAVMEYMMLSNMNMERFNSVHNDMVGAAEYAFDKATLENAVNVERWIEQESKLLQKYEYITDTKKQAEFKRRQAFLNYFTMRGKEARIDLKRFSKKIKRYRKTPEKQDLKYMDGATWDLLKAILYNFKFTKSKPNSDPRFIGEQFDAWIQECLDDGFTMAEDLSQYRDALVDGVDDKVTFKDFEFVRKIFSAIEAIGLERKRISIEGQKKNIEDILDSIETLYAERGTKKLENLSSWGKFKYNTLSIKETILKENMPAEFNEQFVLPLMEGFTKKSIAITEWIKQVEDIIKPLATHMNEKVEIDGRYYTIQNLLVMMLNGGNKHNLDCIVRTLQETYGEGYTYDDYISAITQAPVELRGMAEAIWDIFDRNLPDFLAIQKEIDGKVLRVVQAEPLTLGDGAVLKGGYYPIKSKKKVLDFSDQNAIHQGDGLFATQSFQKDRKTGIHGELDLTLETLHTWFYRMAGVLNVAVPYNNLVRILKNKRFASIVGEDLVDALQQWIELANKPDKTNKAILVADTIMSAKILGFSPLKLLTQATGIFSALGYVPSKYIMHALSVGDLYRAAKKASELSNYMRERYEHPEEHLNLYIRAKGLIGVDLKARSVAFQEAIMKAAMSFIVYGDAFASMTTWKAEYQRQIDAGKSREKAVLLADQAVRITQGDSSAGSRPPIVQGNMRFFTKFASYFIALNSRLTASGMSPKQGSKIAGIVLATCVLAPAVDALFKSLWQAYKEGDESDEDFAMRYLKTTTEGVGSTVGSAFMPAFGIGNAVGSGITGGRIYKPSIPALEFYMTPAYVASDVAGIAKGEDAEKHLKNILIKLLEAGTIKSDYTKAFFDIVEGE